MKALLTFLAVILASVFFSACSSSSGSATVHGSIYLGYSYYNPWYFHHYWYRPPYWHPPGYRPPLHRPPRPVHPIVHPKGKTPVYRLQGKSVKPSNGASTLQSKKVKPSQNNRQMQNRPEHNQKPMPSTQPQRRPAHQTRPSYGPPRNMNRPAPRPSMRRF